MENTIKGARTEQNLLKAFAGESQAKNRYEFFAKQARKEGFEQIAWIFMETAREEQAHAKRFFDFLEGGMLEITAAYPAGIVGSTADNLKAAAEGENEEWTLLYPEFASIAKEEGFNKVATAFKMNAKVEAEHEGRYLKLLQNVSEDMVFMKAGKEWWKCMVCGYTYESAKAMENCPACLHPQKYMRMSADEF